MKNSKPFSRSALVQLLVDTVFRAMEKMLNVVVFLLGAIPSKINNKLHSRKKCR